MRTCAVKRPLSGAGNMKFNHKVEIYAGLKTADEIERGITPSHYTMSSRALLANKLVGEVCESYTSEFVDGNYKGSAERTLRFTIYTESWARASELAELAKRLCYSLHQESVLFSIHKIEYGELITTSSSPAEAEQEVVAA